MLKYIVSCVVLLAVSVNPAWADRDGHDRGYHHRGHYDRHYQEHHYSKPRRFVHFNFGHAYYPPQRMVHVTQPVVSRVIYIRNSYSNDARFCRKYQSTQRSL